RRDGGREPRRSRLAPEGVRAKALLRLYRRYTRRVAGTRLRLHQPLGHARRPRVDVATTERMGGRPGPPPRGGSPRVASARVALPEARLGRPRLVNTVSSAGRSRTLAQISVLGPGLRRFCSWRYLRKTVRVRGSK